MCDNKIEKLVNKEELKKSEKFIERIKKGVYLKDNLTNSSKEFNDAEALNNHTKYLKSKGFKEFIKSPVS